MTTQFLSNELKQAQQGLEEQESALEQFRMQHAGATPDQLDANLQALSRLQAAVQSHMDAISRLDEERLLISQQPIADNHDPSVLGVRGRLLQERNRLENELRTLRRQYTDSYPDVVNIKAQLDSVNAQLSQTASDPASPDNSDSATGLRLNLINKDIEKHKEQIAALQDEIAGYQHKVQVVPVLETQLAELTRNYESLAAELSIFTGQAAVSRYVGRPGTPAAVRTVYSPGSGEDAGQAVPAEASSVHGRRRGVGARAPYGLNYCAASV